MIKDFYARIPYKQPIFIKTLIAINRKFTNGLETGRQQAMVWSECDLVRWLKWASAGLNLFMS